MMTKSSHLTYTERLKELGFPTLEYRRKRADMIQVFKILNDIDSTSNKDLLKLSTYRKTRKQIKII